MRAVTDITRPELEQLLANEIASARSEARPISRLTLTRLLQTKYSLHLHEAEVMVDRYCDEKAPGVPTYLSSEFGTPYLKVLAIINIAVGLGLSIMAAVSQHKGGFAFVPWLLGALLFIGSAALFWVKSVTPEKQKSKTVGMPGRMPEMASSVDEPERVPTRP